MKAHPKGSIARVVIPDIVGEILATEANGDEFGYRVGYGKKITVTEGDKSVEKWETERFFAAHEVEVVAPVTSSFSVSLSGTKADAKAAVSRQVSHPLVVDALHYLIDSMNGDRVSLSGSITPTSISLSGSATITEKE